MLMTGELTKFGFQDNFVKDHVRGLNRQIPSNDIFFCLQSSTSSGNNSNGSRAGKEAFVTISQGEQETSEY